MIQIYSQFFSPIRGYGLLLDFLSHKKCDLSGYKRLYIPSTSNELWRLRISRDVFSNQDYWTPFICEHNFMHMTTCVYEFLKVDATAKGKEVTYHEVLSDLFWLCSAMLSHFSRVWLSVTLWTVAPRLLRPCIFSREESLKWVAD